MINTKKEKAQREVSKPDPANPIPQRPLIQGGGVPSDTLHVEPVNNLLPTGRKSMRIPNVPLHVAEKLSIPFP